MARGSIRSSSSLFISIFLISNNLLFIGDDVEQLCVPVRQQRWRNSPIPLHPGSKQRKDHCLAYAKIKPISFLSNSNVTQLHTISWLSYILAFIKLPFSLFFETSLIIEWSPDCNSLNNIISLFVLCIPPFTRLVLRLNTWMVNDQTLHQNRTLTYNLKQPVQEPTHNVQ